MPFDQKTRNLLQRTVSACRGILDAEFAAQRRSLYGINDDGTTAPLETLAHLPDEDMQVAKLLRDRLHHLTAGLVAQGKKESDAREESVKRLTREQAFTVLNRLAALRMAEEREIVLECVRRGMASEGFELFLQSAGSALGGKFEAYRAYLFLLFDELAIDLGVPTLREWFRRPAGFFADHLKRYSKSRRQAPIYWPLSTASGRYTLWLYYHRLTPDTLYKCLQQFVEPKMKEVEQTMHRLRTMLSADEGGSKERKQLEEAETLLNELKEMHAELTLWAPKWKPNLNDGVLITACPHWKLFRLPKWRKDLEACWKELEAGDYDWAHLALTLWPARVREKCKTDRSLAIAHNLEDLCEVKPPEPKKKRAAKKAPKSKTSDPSLPI